MTLATLNLCVFLLPNTSEEKAGYSITVVFAFAVFNIIVSLPFPQNSDSVAFIVVFLIIQTTKTTSTTVLAFAFLRTSSFDEKVAIPCTLILLLRYLKCLSSSKGNRIVPIQIRSTETRMSDEPFTGDVEYSWKQVVTFLDVVLLVIFACILVTMSLCLF
ncbi:hypothetical protein DPMN_066741 [Dreissena polymorpha]|uniref:Neurotransmitter-gated ion-channel transmembrane domain-containing protein n=1 Tax=Dreissena polymorpha TaxID=45954 RepID=A0A9D3YZL6_DREPO|nr:hypothetical protein DPMN_066741 [Dreissena polymorpha]